MSHAFMIVALDPEEYVGDGVPAAVQKAMAPFREEDCYFENGSRWDWYSIGGRYDGRLMGKNIIHAGDLDLAKIQEDRLKLRERAWDEAEGKGPAIRRLVFGINPDEDKEAYLKRNCDGVLVSAYAFLRKGRWHEAGRLGWFGQQAPTECELENEGQEEPIKRCIAESADGTAKIISWKDEEDHWARRYYERFIKPLPGETALVVVDYHV